MTCGFFLGHLGLGDQILLTPAIQHLAATRGYHKLYVVVKAPYISTISALLNVCSDVIEGEKTIIEFLSIRATANLSEEISEILAVMKTIDIRCQPITMHLSGHFNTEIRDISDFPICFYKQLNIDWMLATTNYFVLISAKSKVLSNLLTYIPYIFIHDISSTGAIGSALDKRLASKCDRFLFINPEKNMYNIGHVFYNLAEQFLRESQRLTLIDYKSVIENAAELHMITSCYFCFAAGLLGVNADVKVAYSRNNDRFMTIAADWTYVDI